ncbi:hypothetical protein D3C85_735000 [compost metagenome]
MDPGRPPDPDAARRPRPVAGRGRLASVVRQRQGPDGHQHRRRRLWRCAGVQPRPGRPGPQLAPAVRRAGIQPVLRQDGNHRPHHPQGRGRRGRRARPGVGKHHLRHQAVLAVAQPHLHRRRPVLGRRDGRRRGSHDVRTHPVGPLRRGRVALHRQPGPDPGRASRRPFQVRRSLQPARLSGVERLAGVDHQGRRQPGLQDPAPGAAGRGHQRLRRPGPPAPAGLAGPEARDLDLQRDRRLL